MSLTWFVCVAYLALVFARCGQCNDYYEQYRPSQLCTAQGHIGVCKEPFINGRYPSICRSVRCAKSLLSNGTYESIHIGTPPDFTSCGWFHLCVKQRCVEVPKEQMNSIPDAATRFRCRNVRRKLISCNKK